MNDFEKVDSLKCLTARKGYYPNRPFSRKVRIKWGAPSQWSSSLFCPVWNSDYITIVPLYPTNPLKSDSCQCPKYKRNHVILLNSCLFYLNDHQLVQIFRQLLVLMQAHSLLNLFFFRFLPPFLHKVGNRTKTQFHDHT